MPEEDDILDQESDIDPKILAEDEDEVVDGDDLTEEEEVEEDEDEEDEDEEDEEDM